MVTPVRSAAPFVPEHPTLDSLQEASRACTGCDLFKNATQTVFGDGPAHAAMMLVGEQPGDQEDRQGAPFVGPAGKMLDRALIDAGIVRGDVYLTNAVKHFKWSPRGRRRIHETPRASEVRACMPWLEAEIDVVGPELVVCLGATAVAALLGSSYKVMRDRGHVVEAPHAPCLITVHPSSLLRVEDEEQKVAAYEAFVSDLRKGVRFIEGARSVAGQARLL